MTVKIDMNMPKNCDECKFKKIVGEWQWDCYLTGKIINCFIRDKYRRHPKCPLYEVKE